MPLVSFIDVSAARPLGQSSPLTAFWKKDASEKPDAFVLQEELDSIVRDLDAQPLVPMAVRRAAIVAARDAKVRVTPIIKAPDTLGQGAVDPHQGCDAMASVAEARGSLPFFVATLFQ